ncbi:MAG: cob(I)yrinic acid a,c-diamide adenosyltransferase [Thalassolituus sp.]|jgi:cob(I)alamin adenosyltransferase|uniref:Corrinoid adenosyltransferase n=1 Tax=Thalassolituus maritimus TaxID=484498 RepID=A0ABQ0A227_9GAMM|nr:cob(I)yrinic acid a,c-diamide adenosyltransferase [Pseudomonadota bacterium]TNC85862.1 MAG: cob(I)yrinic acid a,c-diamide adenosyltransferase [Thalassolituus sp.]
MTDDVNNDQSSDNKEQIKNERHKKKSQKQKEKVDAGIAKATEERGIVIVITGNGKGKSTSGFGTVARAVGHGYKAAVVQFIKGQWDCGERNLLQQNGVPFAVMGTGFTWETQDRAADMAAAEEVWAEAKKFLADPQYHVVLLDELTYMLGYDYLNSEEVLDAIRNRPAEQSVVVTGRGAIKPLRDLADTISEIKDEKHAYRAGIKARKGVDW